MKKTLYFFGNILYAIVVVGVIALALLFLGTRVDFLGYEVKVVKSGSMEPAIQTGGIVIIAPTQSYAVGDVITFGRDTRSSVPVTHRIVEKNGSGRTATYLTKGDANEDIDNTLVRARDIIGKVAFSVPYIGFVIDFARTPLGFFLLIGIPAIFIILDEFADIVWEIHKYRRRTQNKSTQKSRPSQQARTKKRVVTKIAEPSRIARAEAVLDLRALHRNKLHI